MTDKKYVLGIDAGGTFFKSVIVSEDYSILEGSEQKVASGDDKDSIIESYCEIINNAKRMVTEFGGCLIGVGVSAPGPFDYENATSLMKHKLKNIYGLNLREILKSKGVLNDIPISFAHDGLSFLHGEYLLGTSNGLKNVAGVTLGTGVGFALIKDGKLCKTSNGGTAYTIWQNKFKDGIVEDYLSRRGIISIYKKLSGSEEDIDVYDIELLATQNNDSFAYETFKLTGQYLAEAIKDVLKTEKIDCLILGGQISKGFPLMEKALKEGLKDLPDLKIITKGKSIDYSAQIGVTSVLFDRPANKSQDLK